MATGSVKIPLKIELDNINDIHAFYNPNYGEIIGFDIRVTGHEFAIYFNRTNAKIDFYKDNSLIWSK